MKETELLFLHGAGKASKNTSGYLEKDLEKCAIKSYSFNFSGHGGIGIENSSLKKRLQEAVDFVESSGLKEPLNLCGSSMGGYIAIKLLEKYQVENLILFCPAVYDTKAFSLNFDESFTKAIRRKNSWKDSDAFSILENFGGNVLIFIGGEDARIPIELVNLLESSAKKTLSKELVIIPGAPHKIHKFISQNQYWKFEVSKKICSIFN